MKKGVVVFLEALFDERFGGEKKGYSILLDAIRQINRDDFIVWIVGDTYYSENSIDELMATIDTSIASSIQKISLRDLIVEQTPKLED